MRVSRLYVAQPLNVGEQLSLNEDASHYVRTVLRLKQDQAIILFKSMKNCRVMWNRLCALAWVWGFPEEIVWTGRCKKPLSWVCIPSHP